MSEAAAAVGSESAAAIARRVRETTGRGGETGPFGVAAASLEADRVLLAHAFPGDAGDVEPLLAAFARGKGRRAVEAWEGLLDRAGTTPAATLVAADAFRAAPRLSDKLKLALAEELTGAAESLPTPAGENFRPDPTAFSLAAELPLVLALTLQTSDAPVKAKAAIGSAKAIFRENLEAATDTDGTPHAALLPRLPAWLAVLVRATRRADAAGVSLWRKRDRKRLSDLFEIAVSLVRRDGTGVLSRADGPSVLPVLLAGADACDWGKPHEAGRRLLGHAGITGRPEPMPLIEPLVSSEWGRLTTPAADDGPRADRVTLTYDRPEVGVEVAFRGVPVVSGSSRMTARVRVDGRFGERNGATASDGPIGTVERKPYGPWDAVCETGDVDGMYHELFSETDGVTFGRQFFLATDDRVLFVVDSARATGPDAGTRGVDLTVTWPLVDGDPLPASGSAPGLFLRGGKRRVGCYPVHVPQSPGEAVARPGNAVERDGDELLFRAAGCGVAVCVSVFDGAKGTDATVADWRKLTVGEEGRELPDTAAVGYRVRVGKRQWLLTRRFDDLKAMRTVLGLHHNNETVIGRVEGDGSVEAYVLVE